MKQKKPNHFKLIISILDDLGKTYPTYGIGRHLSTALEGYGDLWGVSDKEIHFALTKYIAELQYDNAPRGTLDEEIEKIIKDGINLNLDTEDYG